MIARRTLTLTAVAALAMLLPAARATAQGDTARVATVNPAQVFNQMQETKDLKQKLASDQQQIEAANKQKEAELQEARKARELFNPGTEEYKKANNALIEKAVQLQAWRELTKAQLQRDQKEQMRGLFGKIEEATAEIAKAKKYDIVVVDQRPELPPDIDQINVDQLRAAINSRSVMYNNGNHDLTKEVTANLDAKYKAKK